MKITKTNNHVFKLSTKTVRHHLNSGSYQYLYVSKPDLHDLIDKNGLPLKSQPVWQHGSTTQLSPRITDHDKHAEVLTTSQLKRSVIQKYIRDNNMILSADYYFDIFVLDFTQLFWCFELENRYNRWQAVSYKNALEAVIKTDINKWFLIDGKPVTDRFSHIWGTDYNAYSLETIKTPSKQTTAKANEILQFMDKLSQNDLTKGIVDNALKVLTIDDALNIAKQRYEFRKEHLAFDRNIVTKFTPIF